MSLLAGTKLGPYEIVALIGAGGVASAQNATEPLTLVQNWTAGLKR
jgi:hypothetical protein